MLSAAVRSMPPHTVEFRAVANILHAMAVLHIVDRQLLEYLEQRVVQVPLHLTSAQGTANVAWSVAVLHPIIDLNSNRRSISRNRSDGTLGERLDALLGRHGAAFESSSLSQVHQYLISYAYSRGSKVGSTVSSELIARHLADRCLHAFKAGSLLISASSGQQADVGAVVSALGIAAISEYVDPNTGYSYDFYIPEDGIALEFDGPFHFCRGTRLPLGSTILKHRQIQAQGHILVAVPYWEWAQLATLEEKKSMIQRRVAQAKAQTRQS